VLVFHRVDDDDDDDVSNSVRLGAPNNTKALDTIDPAAKVVVLFRGIVIMVLLDDDDVNDDVNDTDDVNVVRILLLLLKTNNASFVVCVSSAFVCDVKKGFLLLREFSIRRTLSESFF